MKRTLLFVFLLLPLLAFAEEVLRLDSIISYNSDGEPIVRTLTEYEKDHRSTTLRYELKEDQWELTEKTHEQNYNNTTNTEKYNLNYRGRFVGDYKSQNVYNENDKLLSEYSYEWLSYLESWMPVSYREYDYDKFNREIYRLEKSWNRSQNEWRISSGNRKVYEYNTEGIPVSETSEYYDIYEEKWIPTTRNTFEYLFYDTEPSADHKYEECRTYTWDKVKNKWRLDWEELYEYDLNERLLSKASRSYLTPFPEGRISEKTTYAYTEQNGGLLTTTTLYYFSETDGHLKPVNKDSYFESLTLRQWSTERWDNSLDDWAPSTKGESHHDSDGERVYSQSQEYKAGEWRETYLYELEKDDQTGATLAEMELRRSAVTLKVTSGTRYTFRYEGNKTTRISEYWDTYTTDQWELHQTWELIEKAADHTAEFFYRYNKSTNEWIGIEGGGYEYKGNKNNIYERDFYINYQWNNVSKEWEEVSKNEYLFDDNRNWTSVNYYKWNDEGDCFLSGCTKYYYSKVSEEDDVDHNYTDNTNDNAPTGTADHSVDAIEVVPTIVVSDFQVKGLEGDAVVTVVDLQGVVRLQETVSGDDDCLSVDQLEPGVYLVRIATNQSTLLTKKIIIR